MAEGTTLLQTAEWALAFRAHPILQLVEEIANENTISIQIPRTFNLLVHSANRPDYIAQTCNIDISRLLLLYFTFLLFKPPTTQRYPLRWDSKIEKLHNSFEAINQ